MMTIETRFNLLNARDTIRKNRWRAAIDTVSHSCLSTSAAADLVRRGEFGKTLALAFNEDRFVRKEARRALSNFVMARRADIAEREAATAGAAGGKGFAAKAHVREAGGGDVLHAYQDRELAVAVAACHLITTWNDTLTSMNVEPEDEKLARRLIANASEELSSMIPRLGLRFKNANFHPHNSTVAMSDSHTSRKCVQVTSIATDSACADAGLRIGDLITEVNGRHVKSKLGFIKAVNVHDELGHRVAMQLLRDGEEITASVLVRKHDDGESDESTMSEQHLMRIKRLAGGTVYRRDLVVSRADKRTAMGIAAAASVDHDSDASTTATGASSGDDGNSRRSSASSSSSSPAGKIGVSEIDEYDSEDDDFLVGLEQKSGGASSKRLQRVDVAIVCGGNDGGVGGGARHRDSSAAQIDAVAALKVHGATSYIHCSSSSSSSSSGSSGGGGGGSRASRVDAMLREDADERHMATARVLLFYFDSAVSSSSSSAAAAAAAAAAVNESAQMIDAAEHISCGRRVVLVMLPLSPKRMHADELASGARRKLLAIAAKYGAPTCKSLKDGVQLAVDTAFRKLELPPEGGGGGSGGGGSVSYSRSGSVAAAPHPGSVSMPNTRGTNSTTRRSSLTNNFRSSSNLSQSGTPLAEFSLRSSAASGGLQLPAGIDAIVRSVSERPSAHVPLRRDKSFASDDLHLNRLI
jgi:hypothetical protein